MSENIFKLSSMTPSSTRQKTFLFNQMMYRLCMVLSFKTGIFPDLCKLSKIIPIFKKDDPMFCVNYRPISILSIFSKIFEKLIYNRMYSFLNIKI